VDEWREHVDFIKILLATLLICKDYKVLFNFHHLIILLIKLMNYRSLLLHSRWSTIFVWWNSNQCLNSVV
jgi:hypothetical protein